jgi:hypothetical protein
MVVLLEMVVRSILSHSERISRDVIPKRGRIPVKYLPICLSLRTLRVHSSHCFEKKFKLREHIGKYNNHRSGVTAMICDVAGRGHDG